jgi:hypothetical protein
MPLAFVFRGADPRADSQGREKASMQTHPYVQPGFLLKDVFGPILSRLGVFPVLIRAVEVLGPERERVVAAYRAAFGHSVDAYFARIPDAADHPVFRMEPIEEAVRAPRPGSAR